MVQGTAGTLLLGALFFTAFAWLPLELNHGKLQSSQKRFLSDSLLGPYVKYMITNMGSKEKKGTRPFSSQPHFDTHALL